VFLLFVVLGRVAVESIDRSRLCDTKRKPILEIVLQRNIKLYPEFPWLLCYVLAAVKLNLKGKFSDQLFVVAAGAPQSDITIAAHTFTKIELPKRQ